MSTNADSPDQLVTEQVPGTVTVRRSPRYGVFAGVGAAFGILLAMVLSTAFDGTSHASPFTEVEYSLSQTFGFILLWCVPAGILLAMIVALVLEWTIGRRTRQIAAVHETVID
ncbi:potassium transporter Trk [Microbacterium phosphatis]|uniref:potassium transporter Trk n=1 Tax=Microbacterium phosphatis TaxID=3140248 RepID=UPI0031406E41